MIVMLPLPLVLKIYVSYPQPSYMLHDLILASKFHLAFDVFHLIQHYLKHYSLPLEFYNYVDYDIKYQVFLQLIVVELTLLHKVQVDLTYHLFHLLFYHPFLILKYFLTKFHLLNHLISIQQLLFCKMPILDQMTLG